jgi:hypothetical protein
VRVATEQTLIDDAIKFAFDSQVPIGQREKTAFGEKLVTLFLKIVAGPAFFYQMVEWPREYSPGFDLVFLAYRSDDVLAAQAATGYDDLGLTDPWDVGKPTHCIVAEAKCTRKIGKIRTYLRYNRRHRCHQMSLPWLAASVESCQPVWLGELVQRHLDAGTLQRFLIVRLSQEPNVLFWQESDLVAEGIDHD